METSASSASSAGGCSARVLGLACAGPSRSAGSWAGISRSLAPGVGAALAFAAISSGGRLADMQPPPSEGHAATPRDTLHLVSILGCFPRRGDGTTTAFVPFSTLDEDFMARYLMLI